MNRIFPQQQPDDDSPEQPAGSPFEAIFRPLKGERLSEVNITYESGIKLTVSFPPDDEDDADAEE